MKLNVISKQNLTVLELELVLLIKVFTTSLIYIRLVDSNNILAPGGFLQVLSFHFLLSIEIQYVLCCHCRNFEFLEISSS